MPTCVIAQPVHPVGPQLLRAAGITVIEPAGPGLDALRQVIAGADAVLVRDQLPAELIDMAPRLSVIANHGTGTDKIAVAHADALGIPVVYTPQANVRSVAEHALMLMLVTARQAVQADAATRKGHWGFKYEQPMYSLYGKTLGVIGLGRTGRLLCEMAAPALNMQALVWSPSLPAGEALPPGARRVDTLQELLREADVVSLHRPLRPDTRHTLDAATLACMKPGADEAHLRRPQAVGEGADGLAIRHGRGCGQHGHRDQPGDQQPDQHGHAGDDADQIAGAQQCQRKAHGQAEHRRAELAPPAEAVAQHPQAAGGQADQRGHAAARQDVAHAGCAPAARGRVRRLGAAHPQDFGRR
ncbi:D-isomer specific 2-hydroxyacid dehydrogenase, catalytic domain protein, partial [Bordetella bronchiseptica B18-5 (C3)]